MIYIIFYVIKIGLSHTLQFGTCVSAHGPGKFFLGNIAFHPVDILQLPSQSSTDIHTGSFQFFATRSHAAVTILAHMSLCACVSGDSRDTFLEGGTVGPKGACISVFGKHCQIAFQKACANLQLYQRPVNIPPHPPGPEHTGC